MNAVQRTYEIMADQLRTGHWKQGERMPSLASLAHSCTVSRTTMWRALGLLQKQSLVHANRGGAIIAGPQNAIRKPTNQNKALVWQRTANQIGCDVINGHFTDNNVPGPVKLAMRYGVAYNTARKAVHSLVQKGIVQHEGRKLHAIRIQSGRTRPGIMLFSAGSAENGVSTTGERARSLIESFERECSRLGYRSVCEGFDDHSPNALITCAAAVERIQECRGFIVNPWNTWNETCWQRWLDCIRKLLESKVPVIVIDQIGNEVFPVSLTKSNFFRVLRIAGTRAGEMVADMLLKQGHRNIAYLSPFGTLDWVQKRYEGLCTRCREFGGSKIEVELHVRNEAIDQTDLSLALLKMENSGIKALYRERLSREELNGMIERFTRVRKSELGKQIANPPYTIDIRSFAQFLTLQAHKPHDSRIFDGLLTYLEHITSLSAIDLYLRPFFSQVLEKSKATAWVCSDELTATSAFLTLKENGKKIPQEISIIGFENWASSYEHQISAYDFNMNGMVQRAFHLIMDEKLLQQTPVISEVDGYMVERRTTRK